MMRLALLGIVIVFLSNLVLAQGDDVWFQPNRGQWDTRILYRVELDKGDFFVEKDKFTYALSNLKEEYHKAHSKGEEVDVIDFHTVHSHFLNSSWTGEKEESKPSPFYRNYFLGNDSTQWHSKVHGYQQVKMVDFYPGIDLVLEALPTHIKYSFVVAPGADPSQIKIQHEGMDALRVNSKQVELGTRFGSLIENELIVWNEEGDEQQPVEARFKKEQDVVVFDFPNGFDANSTLIIDPSLTFSTFTGSTSDNWGFTAAPDNDGNLYAGGIVFGVGYPVSTGAYDSSFNGGTGMLKIDIGITKFSSDGSSLLYSTYIGGGGNETPNSIVTNNQGELFILGVSASTNFPVTANAYQTQYKGGSATSQIGILFGGTDIIVCKLSANGASLLGSTYLGGSKNDGLNISSLNYNYGDVFRGEIILDHAGDVVITSSTQSSDFPIVNGSNSTLGGNQDGIVAKLRPDMTDVIWSTYLGGSDDDAGYSVQVSSSNNLFVAGGTKSSGLPFSGGNTPSFQGGEADGFVVEINGATSAIMNGTYIGTHQYDQAFFVQLDLSDRVYVFGQTAGPLTVTPGIYNNPNSGQFIQQYSSDLSTLNWSTIVGGGNGVVEISPTAFLVSNCNEIYYTGWGGQINEYVQAAGSTSNGFPVTPDAYQPATNGNNFYIGVLTENAASLKYGTFMGGVASSLNHVDGGTSRFDKQGRIYHAVCGACGGNPNGFTTTPGAFSETNNSSNCNLAAWKFDLGAIESSFSVPNTQICLPNSVHFTNESQNGDEFFWDFGDGSTSTEFEPNHFYSSPGIYNVMLVVKDFEQCFEADTSFLTIEIGEFNGGVAQPTTGVCPGEPYQLSASGGSSYQWMPSGVLDDATIPNPIATIDETTEFTVVVSNFCGADTLKVLLEVFDITTDVIEDFAICIEDTVAIWASGGGTYSWVADDMNAIVGTSTNEQIMVAPEADMHFVVEIETPEGCAVKDSVFIQVYHHVPVPLLEDTVALCKGESVKLITSGAPIIEWSPSVDITPDEGEIVFVSTEDSRWYYVDYTNPCGTVRDSVFIEVIKMYPQAGNDTIICPGEIAPLWASGGKEYQWYPKAGVASPYDSVTTAVPSVPTNYTVLMTDENGCKDSAFVFIDHHPQPRVVAKGDLYGFLGDDIPLTAKGTSEGSYFWSPSEYLSCVNCPDPISNPPSGITYTVTFIDENGCTATDDIVIRFDALLYVPNTFTPDANGMNDVFKIIGGNISEIEILIFNRWGEEVFRSNDMEIGWDGTYNGLPCPDGTYIWKIIYEDYEYTRKELVGHVNLLR